MRELREACAAVAARARSVTIVDAAVAPYAAALPPAGPPAEAAPEAGAREARAAFWLTFDAINFGSGWFPTLRKPPGRSGSNTILAALRAHGPWPADELAAVGPAAVAHVLGQDPEHELMALFAASLNDLGRHVLGDHAGAFAAVADAAGGSAVALARRLGGWRCFADCSRYGELTVPFLKRAQIAAADLHRAGVARFGDLARLTMFADNLVPHVLRLDGVLRFDPALVARIERGELIQHESAEEVEMRACAVDAVERLVAARDGELTAADVDHRLWHRGQQPRYKAVPRPRCRCTAY